MWAVGVFLMYVSGSAWLFRNEMWKNTFNCSGVRGQTFGKVLEPGLQIQLAEKSIVWES